MSNDFLSVPDAWPPDMPQETVSRVIALAEFENAGANQRRQLEGLPPRLLSRVICIRNDETGQAIHLDRVTKTVVPQENT